MRSENTINEFTARTSQGWMAAHSLLNTPKALEAAFAMAKKESSVAKLLTKLTSPTGEV